MPRNPDAKRATDRRQTPARPSTLRARELRQTQTSPEAKLWDLLRNRQLENYKWKRQVPIGRYYADFCCPASKLIIELDGSSHADREEYDAIRDASLKSEGWRTLRIANSDLMRDEEGVWQTIEAKLNKDKEAEIT